MLYALWCAHDLSVARSIDPLHRMTVSQVDEIFDAISYQKGASLIRMVEAFIGTDNMKKGLQQYLTKQAYSNALTEDLWAALGEVREEEEDADADADAQSCTVTQIIL